LAHCLGGSANKADIPLEGLGLGLGNILRSLPSVNLPDR